MRHVESDYSVVSMGVMVGAVVVRQLRKVQLPTHFTSNTIKETIRVCVRSVSSFVRSFFVRHTQLQKSLIRRIDSANKY